MSRAVVEGPGEMSGRRGYGRGNIAPVGPENFVGAAARVRTLIMSVIVTKDLSRSYGSRRGISFRRR